MPKKKAPQSGELIRGGADNLHSITETGYSGKVPVAGIIELERESIGIVHGIAILELHIRDGKLARFVSSRERSFTRKGCEF